MKMSFHELETFGACFRAYCKSHVLYAEVLYTPRDLQACGSDCRAFMKVLTFWLKACGSDCRAFMKVLRPPCPVRILAGSGC